MDINGIMKNKITKKSTIRDVLQILGTELLREGFNNNIHVAATLGSIKENENVIITDTRFPNELEAVKKREGITIRVNRNFEGKWIDKQEWDLHTKGIVPHESETALDNAEFDYEIINDGTISELIDKIRNILIENKLIKNK